MVSSFLGRLLPFGINGRLAATIMGADRWNAGAALIAAQSPEAWHKFMDEVTLMKSNQAGTLSLPRGGGEGEERTALQLSCTGAVIGATRPDFKT